MTEQPGSDPRHPIDSPTGWVAKQIAKYVATDGREGSTQRGAPLLLLTTQGRKSGKWRRTALIFGERDGKFIIVASKGGAPAHPSWYLNLVANPEVRVQVYDRIFAATARTATAGEKPALWSLMASIWPDYNVYTAKTDRDIPVVVLDPVAD
ncbi:nitroreductase family deazaflavin-dependent oxidoreductase [Parafrigoribacterium mesophilum]|uniref:nitroreductase family deazaflavin-dependent oxidoreductase n=1 Tax=Parafrigoribacterium mesophilum TaxID=433646 RepID=UPI0031FC04CC